MFRFLKRRDPARLSDWRIVCGPANPNWQVNLGDCDRAHAESVAAQLRADPSCPDDLTLEEVR